MITPGEIALPFSDTYEAKSLQKKSALGRVLQEVEQEGCKGDGQEQTRGWMEPWLAASPVLGPPALK